MSDNITIAKDPQLPQGQDYNAMRLLGQQYIAQLGSSIWTDYNIHDPGITILEALVYAITDLTYRASFAMQDLLAVPPQQTPDPDLQALFTAKNILTVNPWTEADYRKLLIDTTGVKNAWLSCRCCPCDDIFLYANCKTSTLQYQATEHPIRIRGMYDVSIEIEDDGTDGDLNSGKIIGTFGFPNPADPTGNATATLEVRLPAWEDIRTSTGDLLSEFTAFRNPSAGSFSITVGYICGNTTDKVDVPAGQLTNALKAPLFAGLTIGFTGSGGATTLTLDNVPVSVWFTTDSDRTVVTIADLRTALSNPAADGIVASYHDKLQKADIVMAAAQTALQSHRNLCEDYCIISAVKTQDIAICADIDLSSGADIVQVLAQAYYAIDQYMCPDLQFYSLAQMQAKGLTIDAIFDGPPLDHGFIDNDNLAATQLKTVLYGSEIIELLLQIDGVTAVRNFTISPYDDSGNRLAGQTWVLPVTPGYQPRLYLLGSKMLVYKGGLPLLPDPSELNDELQVIEGQHLSSRYSTADTDLPVPVGTYYSLTDYFPVQYSLPLTYGIGPAGLPSDALPIRTAQARQLKAYLLFFDEQLASYLDQLSHLKDLFSLDPTVTNTYFTRLFTEADIVGISDLYSADDPLDATTLDTLGEDQTVYLDRRNRFLDHLLSRFGEQFSDYALMLYNVSNNDTTTSQDLITDKIAFLGDMPFVSANRGRAFNYQDTGHVCDDTNIAGLKKRIQDVLALGDQDLLIVEHLLLRPRNLPGTNIPKGDPFLSICIPGPPDCQLCGEEDPYSFRLTIVMNGETGVANSNIQFRRFAEDTIRSEAPAHLGVKICWVSLAQFTAFKTLYCDWLTTLAAVTTTPAANAAAASAAAVQLSQKLTALITEFLQLKSVYPKATLHDCTEGDDTNRVFLDQTII